MADPQHVTLVADEVTEVVLGADANKITVLNVDGVAAVYFNINTAAAPEVGGDGCWALPAAISAVDVPVAGPGNTRVKLISAGTPTVMVGRLS
ncbi:hypothetical protein ACGFNU_21430 [Spirillospora sp. NPDC048911]|uniref:hypothetical protein n=1 Tax=Spirillospora sp. NPDC048911 TaxID=3364527 RepID=UPI00371F8A18